MQAAIDARVSRTKPAGNSPGVSLVPANSHDSYVSRGRQVAEKQLDIDAIKQLLVTIGIPLTDAGRHAESLVIDHKVNSVMKFQRKVGSDVAGYSAILQLDTDDVELLEEYFKQHANVSTPPALPPLSSPVTTGGSSAPTSGGGAARTAKHWNCFMVPPLSLTTLT